MVEVCVRKRDFWAWVAGLVCAACLLAAAPVQSRPFARSETGIYTMDFTQFNNGSGISTSDRYQVQDCIQETGVSTEFQEGANYSVGSVLAPPATAEPNAVWFEAWAIYE